MEKTDFKAKKLLTDTGKSKMQKYQELIIGQSELWTLIKYELIMMLCNAMPGALGLLLVGPVYLLQSLRNPGDVCEFGVAQGATSTLLAREIMDTNRNLWLFDSFEGLPKPHAKDKLINDIFGLGSMASYEGQMKCQADEVMSRLTALHFPDERVRLIAGWVEDSLQRAELPEQVAFAYIDFDFYNPIKETLRFLDGRMPPESSIIVDDYDFFSSGAKTAVDEFIAETNGRYHFAMPIAPAGHFCILTKRR